MHPSTVDRDPAKVAAPSRAARPPRRRPPAARVGRQRVVRRSDVPARVAVLGEDQRSSELGGRVATSQTVNGDRRNAPVSELVRSLAADLASLARREAELARLEFT